MTAVPTSLAAALVGRYALDERALGRGGMETVYLARDLRHRRRVALKVLHPDLGALAPEQRVEVVEEPHAVEGAAAEEEEAEPVGGAEVEQTFELVPVARGVRVAGLPP